MLFDFGQRRDVGQSISGNEGPADMATSAGFAPIGANSGAAPSEFVATRSRDRRSCRTAAVAEQMPNSCAKVLEQLLSRRSGQSPPKFGPNRAEFGPIQAEVGQVMPNFKQTWTNSTKL